MSISRKNLRFSLDTNPNIGYNPPMLYDKLLKSGINRVFFATILAIMWLAPVVFGWIAFETSHHHGKMVFAFCAVGCLVEVYAITFLLGGMKYIRTRA